MENWRGHYVAAFEAYNRYHCEVISSTEAKFSPIEIWRPGYTVTPYKIQVLREPDPKYSDRHLSDLQTGTYEVTEVAESGVDYLIKKIGSSMEPIRCHIDFLNLFRTFDLPADSEPKAPVAAKSTEYSAERIMGEKTHSACLGEGSHSWSNGQTTKLAQT